MLEFSSTFTCFPPAIINSTLISTHCLDQNNSNQTSEIKSFTLQKPTLFNSKANHLALTSQAMALFPRLTTSEFGPLFRLLDDYDSHRNSTGRGSSSVRAFQPKFDVREYKTTYELYGEFPGVSQKDVSIEFTDPYTIVISGSTLQKSNSNGPQGRVTGEVKDTPHKVTVEDEEPEKGGNQTVATKNNENGVSKKSNNNSNEDKPEIWLSERLAGEFHRSFSFPVRVDQDGTKADMKDGVLHISIPKGSQDKGRKINIG